MNNARLAEILLAALHPVDLENFVTASTPGGIEKLEKAGQIEQSFLETLPIDGTSSAEHRAQFEALGFKFALDRTEAQSQGGEIFVNTTFPKGWRKKVTDHDMWSNLLDDKGRKRGAIFYKAVFYDRSAQVSLNLRYSYSIMPIEGWDALNKSGKWHGVVKDGNEIIFKTEPTEPEPKFVHEGDADGKRRWLDWTIAKDSKRDEARLWLNKKYPDWEKVTAYWD